MKTQDELEGIIDDSFEEVDLTDFIKENPTLISDLKEKYNI